MMIFLYIVYSIKLLVKQIMIFEKALKEYNTEMDRIVKSFEELAKKMTILNNLSR